MSATATIERNRLLTESETAEWLGIKKQTLTTWRSTGRHGLPFVRVGTSIRYSERAIENWLAARTVAPAES